MARAKFVKRDAGYNALKSSAQVVSFTAGRADAIARAAAASSGEEYESSTVTNLANRRMGVLGVVATGSYDAIRENEKNNTLLKAVNAGRF